MQNINMPAPCVGTLQKTHRKSKFIRFHVTSRMAGWVFSDRPHLNESKDYERSQSPEIVVLQIMCFGDKELLIEYVEKQYWEE